jgi:hypothetical protein
MSVYTTVFAASVPIGGLATGALASSIGVLQTILVGGVLSLATGIGAVIWYRRIKAAGLVSGNVTHAERPADSASLGAVPAVSAAGPMPAVQSPTAPAAPAASGAPNTRAAFKPPKPNDVLSTRR